uniref:Uncharacterized protein n=1 Tax=Arundo donax TaxID=35708 RepID=A0A0A8ZSK1_ARUDO
MIPMAMGMVLDVVSFVSANSIVKGYVKHKFAQLP